MSFHDNIALKAMINGKSPQQYADTAKKHLNATWVYIFIAGLILSLGLWQWALIPSALATLTILQSISSLIVASKLKRYDAPP